MLGRHVYRVQPQDERWTVLKEGETGPRAAFDSRDEAMTEARRLARAEQPSKVVIGDGDGLILNEEAFGQELSDELGS
jgi:Uncharacterized protein conserved in bacteria (DUF2188)